MDSIAIPVYIGLTVIMTSLNFYLSYRAWCEHRRGCRLLSMTSLFAGLVNLVYGMSVFVPNYHMFSALSSAYFICVDFMALALLGFAVTINTKSYDKGAKVMAVMSFVCVALDILQFVINPFKEISLSYRENPGIWPRYTYKMYFLYNIHLLIVYVLIALALVCLVNRSRKIPTAYRGPYRFSIFSILMVVAINAVFLYVESDSFISRVDVSTLTYGIVTGLVYWSFYEYSTSGMLKVFKMSIFDNSDRGIILFSYDKELLLFNKIAENWFAKDSLKKHMKLEDFAEQNKIGIDASLGRNFSKQFYVEKDGKTMPIRCDYKIIRDDSGEVIGHLFLFNNMAGETDILTGFHNWDNFVQFIGLNTSQFSHVVDIAIVDINALSVINHTLGWDEGDRKIKELSDLMREYFPEGTYFVRGHDARLIAICSGIGEENFRICVQKMRNKFEGSLQYALNSVDMDDPQNGGIIDAINVAKEALNTKKLQDQNSSHSEVLSTLVKALEECDSDTEQHVQRTREIGKRLGKRIGLSDIQLSHLSLLCLLHDIGKIGVSLNILNKPSRLTDEEFEIMKTHSEKGYQIAKSAKELSMIADMIRYHHERWDGKGYPDGLTKESIPLLSRMISVIDAYDAMVSDRVYRKAMTGDEAIAEMERCAGTQFDPHIVTEFVAMLREEGGTKIETQSKRNGFAPKNPPVDAKKENKIENISVVEFCRYVVDEQNKIIEVDDSFEEFTGYTKEEVEAKNLHQIDMIPEADRLQYLSLVNEQMAKSTTAYFEHRLKKKNGDCIQVLCIGQANETAEGLRTTIVISNIMKTQAVRHMLFAEQNKSQERLRQWETQYRSDPLTGLMNRVAFKNDVDSRLIAKKHKVLMLMMDIDKFKEYNDTYGHQKGDELLVLLGQTLSSLLRDNDYACRIGGDEFAAALLFNAGEQDEVMYRRANQIYAKLVSTMRSSLEFSGISTGAIVASEKCATFDKLYQEADRLLYVAKDRGRNQLVCGNAE